VGAAGSSLSLKEVLVNLSRSVVDLSVGERCSIFLFNAESGTLEPIMSMGPEDPVWWEKFRDAAGLRIPEVRGIGTAADLQEPVIEEHAPGSGIVPEVWIETFGLKSLAIYPLVAKDTTVGVMVVDSFTDFVRFPPEEVDTLAAIARQAAVIIENARLHEKVQQQAIADPLTGLYNHRHLRERLEQEIARAKRSRRPVSVLMVDIDGLKLINDTYGHQVGDQALKFLSSVLRDSCRVEDIVGRYGGDEFTVILPEADLPEARRVAERIQSNLATRCLEREGEDIHVPVRLSMGLACYPSDTTVMHELVDVADSALYRSKQRGGGCITTARGRVEELMPAAGTAFSAMQGLVAALIQKEPFTREHVGDVAKYSVLIATALGLGEKQKDILRRAGWVHDVGKIAIPDGVVLKPGPLDEDECEVIRQHVAFSETILRGIDHLADVVPTVAAHHEWFDGSGYPRGLKGRRIPTTGRILSVADAYLAMTSDRPYRPAMSREEAVEELRRGAGTQFDPKVVEAFIQVLGSGAVDSRAA
jgi:diguanylate cyclase (GGDEF)-like protein